MPPKAQPKTNAKEHQKKMQKVIEDKTFGLKNKKGAKMQKYIAQLQNQVQGSQKQFQNQQKAKKNKEEDDLKDLASIFKPVQSMPKIAADVDPKSVLCVFFKQGMCSKGKKCPFSHDLSVQQKTAKKNLFVDSRDLKKDEEKETNENWDEAHLNDVAEKKHGEKDRKRPNQTDIVCKYFIEAVEKSLYGWFWECPNGEKCIYRHALPPGYILSKDRKKMEEQKKLDEISLEELIEKERANLSSKNQTKVTLETFIAWKKKKLRESRQKKAEEEQKKKTILKSGKQGGLSGRELFTFDPKIAVDDDNDLDGGLAATRDVANEGEDEVKAFEINDRTFLDIGEDGKNLDDDWEEDPVPTNTDEPGPSKPVIFDESVFNAEDAEDLPDTDDETDDEAEQEVGSDAEVSKTSKLGDEVNCKLKI